MKAILSGIGNWFDDRTGYRQHLNDALYENIPGGSRWIYVTGSMLVFAFVTQTITGLFLWMFYSAGSQNAWESVFWIQNHVQGGWLLRGVHHSMAQAMVVLMPIHLLQVVLCRAYIKPREVNYWLGLIMLPIVLGLGLTGYLLPWDQKGYWATKVATELMSLPPGGAYFQKLVVGGSEYGHYTLTRFFAVHAGVLPALLIGVLVLHVAMFRRHGITAKSRPGREDQFFWPNQVFKDAFACFVLLVLVVGFVVYEHGPELGPPAEPTESFGAARPEWYYLFLFQLLKKAPDEFTGAIIIPSAVMGFLFVMPLFGRIRFGHIVNVVIVLSLLACVIYLTYEAIQDDNYASSERPEPTETAAKLLHLERLQASRDFMVAQELAEKEYQRVKQVIDFKGIPRTGATVGLVRQDPEIQGPRIFVRNCKSCHSYLDENGHGIPGPTPPRDENGELVQSPAPYGAPNLFGIGSRAWFRKLLDHEHFVSDEMFGLTKHKEGEMAQFLADELSQMDEEGQAALESVIVALSAEARLVDQRQADREAAAVGTIQEGIESLDFSIVSQACVDCHRFHDLGEPELAPDLTGYGSYQWLYEFISNPSHVKFYGDNNDRMPAYAEHPADPSKNQLTHHDIDMLVRWLRGDDRDLQVAEQIRQEITPRDETITPSVKPQQDATEATATDVAAAPLPEGQQIYQRRCARCHAYLDEAGQGLAGAKPRESGSPNGAPNLYGFASRKWLAGLLDPDRIVSQHYFGNTALKEGDMVGFVQESLAELDQEQQQQLTKLIAALSAEAKLQGQSELDSQAESSGVLQEGRDALVNEFGCIDCHKFRDEGELGVAPDLTGYGSFDWLVEIISNPESERFYPETNDRMPAFAPHADPERNQLSRQQLETLVRWLRGEDSP